MRKDLPNQVNEWIDEFYQKYPGSQIKCKKCNRRKALTKFNKCKANSNGLVGRCKECVKKYRADYNERNRKEIRRKNNLYKKINSKRVYAYVKEKGAHKKYLKKYYEENKEKIKARVSENSRRNLGLSNARKRLHKLRKKKAAPLWLTEYHVKKTKEVYVKAKRLEELDGIKRHVDHQIPLKGVGVCGLHVPWNLQILTEKENLEKYNNYG